MTASTEFDAQQLDSVQFYKLAGHCAGLELQAQEISLHTSGAPGLYQDCAVSSGIPLGGVSQR